MQEDFKTIQKNQIAGPLATSQLVCLGLSHHTANIELREYFNRLALSGTRDPAIQELAIVATCNRVELYAWLTPGVTEPQATLAGFLAQLHNLPASFFAKHTYYYQGQAVVEHLCRVAAGLDSLVLGEAQILGQVTQAFMAAQAARTLGANLSLLFRTAMQAGKRVHAETAIDSNPASTSSVALALATTAAGDLRQRRVLVIGLGEIGQLTLRLLHARGVRQLWVVNRDITKAAAAATRWQAQIYPLAELAAALATADVVISATSAPQPLISTAMLRQVMAVRGQQPLVLVDLAVPRDIEPAVAALPNVQYFDVDDLRAEQDATRHSRQQELPHAEAIINAELVTWQRNLQELAVKPVIVNLRQRAENIRQQEVARTLRFLGQADAATLDQIEQLSRALVNQLLHQPTLRLKASAANNESAPYIALTQELFGLEP